MKHYFLPVYLGPGKIFSSLHTKHAEEAGKIIGLHYKNAKMRKMNGEKDVTGWRCSICDGSFVAPFAYFAYLI